MTTFFVIISDLGHGGLYLVVCLCCYLLSICLPNGLSQEFIKVSWRLSTFWSWGVLFNLGLKFMILAPRPWYLSSILLPLHPSPSGGYGMPSGHTQSAVGIYFLCLSLNSIFAELKYSRLLSLTALVLGSLWVVLIGASRIYLHAHSFEQVFTGGSCGLGLMFFIIWIENRPKGGIWGGCFMLLNLSLCLWRSFYHYQVPQTWLDRSAEYAVFIPQSPNIKVITASFIISLFCLLFHFGAWSSKKLNHKVTST